MNTLTQQEKKKLKALRSSTQTILQMNILAYRQTEDPKALALAHKHIDRVQEETFQTRYGKIPIFLPKELEKYENIINTMYEQDRTPALRGTYTPHYEDFGPVEDLEVYLNRKIDVKVAVKQGIIAPVKNAGMKVVRGAFKTLTYPAAGMLREIHQERIEDRLGTRWFKRASAQMTSYMLTTIAYGSAGAYAGSQFDEGAAVFLGIGGMLVGAYETTWRQIEKKGWTPAEIMASTAQKIRNTPETLRKKYVEISLKYSSPND